MTKWWRGLALHTTARSELRPETTRHLEAHVPTCGFVRAHCLALLSVDHQRGLRFTLVGDMVAVLDCGTTMRLSRRRRAAVVGVLRAQ